MGPVSFNRQVHRPSNFGMNGMIGPMYLCSATELLGVIVEAVVLRSWMTRHPIARCECLAHVVAAVHFGLVSVFGEEGAADEHLAVAGSVRGYAFGGEAWPEKGDQSSGNAMTERSAQSSGASVWHPIA